MHAPRRRKKRSNYGVRSVELARGRQGFGFTISGQQPCILSCIVAGSPAERAGLRAGDYLVSANGQGVGRTPHDEVVRLIGSARGTLRLQIAESYYSDSSDDDAAAAQSPSRPKPKGKPRPPTAQNRAAKVIRDLHTGAMFGEEGAVPPPARPRPPAAGADACLLRCLVGYLGTIEMPRDLQPGSRLQVVRSCIRRLGGERGAATPVLLEAAPRWLALANAAGRALARLPGARVAFASRDARAFALVTAGPGAASACHVFSLEPAAHERHAARAAAFQLECSRSPDPSVSGCAEFPADALGLVARFQALARAPSPAPSSRSSSNSDSGVGFREAACAQPDRILVVDVRNQRLLVHAPGAATPPVEYDTTNFPLPAFGLGAFHSLPAASHLAGSEAHRLVGSDAHQANDSVNDSMYCAANDSKYSAANVSAFSLASDASFGAASSAKYSGANDSKYSATSEAKYSAGNETKYGASNDSKYSGANESKYSASSETKYSGTNELKYSAANDSKYSVANVSSYGFGNDSAYNVADDTKYSVANVSSYSAAIDSTYSVANPAKYSVAKARTYSVANARTYSVASTYDLPSVPLSSGVATSFDLPSVPPKHELPCSVVRSHERPGEISTSVETAYRSPSVATRYSPPKGVASASHAATLSHEVSGVAKSPCEVPCVAKLPFDVPSVAKSPSEVPNVCKSPCEMSSVASLAESSRLTVRAMRDPLPPSSTSPIGCVLRPMGSQDSVNSKPMGSQDSVHSKPMGSLDSVRSSPQTLGSQDSIQSQPVRSQDSKRSQKMGSQDSVLSALQPMGSQESVARVVAIGSTGSGAGSSPWRPRLWGSMQELSSGRRRRDTEPSGGEGEEGPRSAEGAEGGPTAWAASFERLLDDPVGMDAFAEFLKKEFSHENIAFYASCERFRRASDDAARRSTAADIFARHLAPSASEPVNVDAAARQVSADRLRQAPADLFTSAQKQIFNLMKFDSYPRFLKSAGYQACVDRAVAEAACASAEPSAASAKLKKSRSDAEERRRRSLLPWQRRGRSQSRDRSDEGGGAWDVALRGAHSRQSLGGGPSAPSGDKECPGLCRVTLPDGATTVLRPRPGEHVGELAQRLLERRGLGCANFTAFLDDSLRPLQSDTDCAVLRGRRMRIERNPITTRPRPAASLDEITNRVFEELLRGKDAAPAAPCSVKSEDWGSEHSSGILGRFMRRDSAHDKHRESRSKKKTAKAESAASPAPPANTADPLLSPDLFEGLKRAQRSRLEDQRGTEINFELPDFLKDKENACRTPKPAPLETDVDAVSPPYGLLRDAVSGGAGPTSPPPPPLPPKPRLAPRAPLNWPRARQVVARTHGRAVADVTNHAADARAMPPPAARAACRGRHRAVYLDQPTSSFV